MKTLLPISDIKKLETLETRYMPGNPHQVTKGEPAYSPLFDKLFMPDLAEFESPEKFYHTYFPRVEPLDGHGFSRHLHIDVVCVGHSRNTVLVSLD